MLRRIVMMTAGILLVVGMAGILFGKQIVWEHESGTDLVWNNNEAYVVVRTQRSGWQGNLIKYVGLIVRSFVMRGMITEGDKGARRTIVIHIARDVASRH